MVGYEGSYFFGVGFGGFLSWGLLTFLFSPDFLVGGVVAGRLSLSSKEIDNR